MSRKIYNRLSFMAVSSLDESTLGTDSGDACTVLQYEKMFGNAGFVNTTQYSVSDSPRQLLL